MPPVWPGERRPPIAGRRSSRSRGYENSCQRSSGTLNQTFRLPKPCAISTASSRFVGVEHAVLGRSSRIRGPARRLARDGVIRDDAAALAAIDLVLSRSRSGAASAYPCDNFAWWQDNLYAIAVVLEDLRRAERYGVQSALLRAGLQGAAGAAERSPRCRPRASGVGARAKRER
jgi:hypothetical protein